MYYWYKAGPFVNPNRSTRYLYTPKEVIKVVKSSLSKCIRNLLNAVMISSRVRYLYP